ncbi:Sulfate transporter [Burkholderia multivorans]
MAEPPRRPLIADTLSRWLPGLATLRHYQRDWLAKDVFAGVVLTAVLVPVGMSYAQAAGLPVSAGLYATVAALVGYGLAGPTRVLVLGPDSALAALIAGAVAPLAHGDPRMAVDLAAMLAMLSGAFCILIGLLRLGFVTDLLSKPIQYGYLNGIAVTLIAGQLPNLFGFHVPTGAFVDTLGQVATRIAGGQLDSAPFALGAGCIAAIVLLRRFASAWPGVLIAVIATTLVSLALPDAWTSRVVRVGTLPAGILAPHWPAVSWDDGLRLVADAFATALVSFADISVLSRVFAGHGRHETDRNQEVFALGVANLLAGMFRGCAVSSSASRTPVAIASGAQTQVTGLVAAACIVVLLGAIPTLLARVPQAALAAVVIAASIAIVDLRGMARLYRMRRSEFAVSACCFAGVALLGVMPGIFVAIGMSLLSFVWRAWHPYDAVLGRVDGTRGYHDVSRHPDARRTPGLVLFRWDAPLFYANAGIFRDHVLDAIDAEPAPAPANCVVIAAEPITDVDVTAADMLSALRAELEARHVQLWFAEVKGPVKDRLRDYGLYAQIGAAHFFPTVTDAVAHYARTRKPGSVAHAQDDAGAE